MNDKERFSIKLKEALVNKGYVPTPAVLEREFNLRNYGDTITPQAARKWLNGQAIPRLQNLRQLAKWLDVNIYEFVSLDKLKKLEKGEIRRNGDSLLWEKDLSIEDKQLFNQFLLLPDQQKNAVREIINALSQTQQTIKRDK